MSPEASTADLASTSRHFPMPVWEDLIRLDLEVSWKVNEHILRWSLAAPMDRVISDSPIGDVSLITWAALFGGTAELGLSFLWAAAANLFAAFTVRCLVQAKRPVEYDQRLQPRTDRAAGSFGFPSLESYMAVVIFGYILHRTTAITLKLCLAPLFLAVTAVVGVSRVYSCSRFAHQILASWLLGFLGLAITVEAENCLCRILPRGLLPRHHAVLGMLCGIPVLAYLALAMESGDTRFFGWQAAQRREYARVLSRIFRSSTHVSEKQGGDNVHNFGHGRARSGASGSAAATGRGAEDPNARRALTVREIKRCRQRDSFYYLHKTMLGRAERAEKARESVASSYAKAAHLLPRRYEVHLPHRGQSVRAADV